MHTNVINNDHYITHFIKILNLPNNKKNHNKKETETRKQKNRVVNLNTSQR